MEQNTISNQVQALFRFAKTDPEYAKMNESYRNLELQVEKMAQRYPKSEQDLLWAFICVSESMNHRMMEIICERYGIDA